MFLKNIKPKLRLNVHETKVKAKTARVKTIYYIFRQINLELLLISKMSKNRKYAQHVKTRNGNVPSW